MSTLFCAVKGNTGRRYGNEQAAAASYLAGRQQGNSRLLEVTPLEGRQQQGLSDAQLIQ
jgi:hypothetical protein